MCSRFHDNENFFFFFFCEPRFSEFWNRQINNFLNAEKFRARKKQKSNIHFGLGYGKTE